MSYQRRGPRTGHLNVARAMKEQPGVWLPVSEYSSRSAALNAALSIRKADPLRVYRPAGAFETRTEMTEYGTAVLARYVGRPS
ncbi:MAG: hypothetical protein LBV60_21325 [Streptomyces sp.]|jgi:hypothetical protein|nr:hypothetical protein [Streptomyces sp.]